MKAKMGNTGDVKVEITELDAPAVIPQNLLERVLKFIPAICIP